MTTAQANVLGSEAAYGRFFVPPTEYGLHVLSAQQFGAQNLEALCIRTDELRRLKTNPQTARELATTYLGQEVCSLFYEPSTRTRTSFEHAALALGIGVVSTENAKEFSSAAKGETIADTIRVLGNFAAVILRHHETGSAAIAASRSKIPIINAGDGRGEHPTQALLDVYTIQHHKDRLSGLHVVMGGDLMHGRTVRSLAIALSKFPNNHISFVSTPDLRMEPDIKRILTERGTTYDETFSMSEALEDPLRAADVIYWTRTQTERFARSAKTPWHKKLGDMLTRSSVALLESPARANGNSPGSFVIDRAALDNFRKDAIIMHPLPRVWEITPEVDGDARAVYFDQANYGLLVRIAVLGAILG